MALPKLGVRFRHLYVIAVQVKALLVFQGSWRAYGMHVKTVEEHLNRNTKQTLKCVLEVCLILYVLHIYTITHIK